MSDTPAQPTGTTASEARPEGTSPDTAQPFDLEAFLKVLPRAPGVYIMKDRKDAIIYIGKSVNLRSRVRSYFRGGDPRPFVRRLPGLLGGIETIVTDTEYEALRLEATLIRTHRPRYNVALMDDSLWLRIDVEHPWPTIEVVREVARDGARYFGEYPSAGAARRTVELLTRNFTLRTCSDAELATRQRPCLQYQIKRCPAPCVLKIQPEGYRANVDESMLFLEGRFPELRQRLEDQMWSASDLMAYEAAARYRDQLRAIDAALDRYQIVSTDKADKDAVGLYREGERITLQILGVRGGRLMHSSSHALKNQAFPDEEVLSSFIGLYYGGGRTIPDQILLPRWIEDQDAMGRWLGELRGRPVGLLTPSDGEARALVAMANRNACHTFRQQHNEQEQRKELLLKLQRRLNLTRFPQRIECFDISNLQGGQVVGSMAVFIDGEVASRERRTFKVKGVEGQDDFASMAEIIGRRFERARSGDWPWPDLVIIDGGKGQLSAAHEVLAELEVLDRVDLISLAKSRTIQDSRSQKVHHTLERVFLPGRKNPVILQQNSAELFLLQRVRDEAHDIAINFHRKLRRKASMTSSLETIPGVGPGRRKALLRHFGSVNKLRVATLEELRAVPGIGRDTAQTIYEALRPPA